MLFFLLPTLALAAPTASELAPSEGVVVEADREPQPPCRRALHPAYAPIFPGRDASDLLRSVPGLTLFPHLGRGGAPVMGWRGFDMGYGRDLAVQLDGVPLNEPSHVAGHGYVDLHLVPTLLTSSVDHCVGAANASSQAFATAGAVQVGLGLLQSGFQVRLGGGSDGSGAARVAWRPSNADEHTFVFAEIEGGEGVGLRRGWRHLRIGGGISGNLGAIKARAWLLTHDGTWDIPGLLRVDDLRDGRLRFFGDYLAHEGSGVSRRALAAGRIEVDQDWGRVRVLGWAGARGFELRNNLTGFLHDPVNGDGEQRRQRSGELGLRADYHRDLGLLPDGLVLDAGFDLHAGSGRQRTASIALDASDALLTDSRRVVQSEIAGWAATRLGLSPRFALTGGVRAGQLNARTVGALGDLRSSATFVAPRIAADTHLSETTQLHLSVARGYRPFDARFDVPGQRLSEGLTHLVSELHLNPLPALTSRISGSYAWSRYEQVFDPVDGRLLAVGAVRRAGFDVHTELRPTQNTRTELTVGWGEAWRPGGDRLPGVPRLNGSAAFWFLDMLANPGKVSRRAAAPLLLSGGVRAWFLGPRLLQGGFRAQPVATADLTARLSVRRWTFDATLDNLIPWRWRNAEYVFPSQWRPDDAAVPKPHISAGIPFSLRFGVSAWF